MWMMHDGWSFGDGGGVSGVSAYVSGDYRSSLLRCTTLVTKDRRPIAPLPANTGDRLGLRRASHHERTTSAIEHLFCPLVLSPVLSRQKVRSPFSRRRVGVTGTRPPFLRETPEKARSQRRPRACSVGPTKRRRKRTHTHTHPPPENIVKKGHLCIMHVTNLLV